MVVLARNTHDARGRFVGDGSRQGSCSLWRVSHTRLAAREEGRGEAGGARVVRTRICSSRQSTHSPELLARTTSLRAVVVVVDGRKAGVGVSLSAAAAERRAPCELCACVSASAERVYASAPLSLPPMSPDPWVTRALFADLQAFHMLSFLILWAWGLKLAHKPR